MGKVSNNRILGREPVLWLSLPAITVKVVSAFLAHVSTHQQAVINATAAATRTAVRVPTA